MNNIIHPSNNDHMLSIIGSGQLATSYLTGLLASGYPPHRCVGLQRSGPSFRFMPARQDGSLCGVEWTDQLEKLPLDVLVLAIKRKDTEAISVALKRAGRRPRIVLSTVAGMSLAELEQAFSPSIGTVRCMPNLGVAVRRSSTLVWPYADLCEATRHVVDDLFGAVGTLWPMESESLFDRATAFAAAGPAYLARMALALERGGMKLGLDAATSAAISRELCTATGKLLDAPLLSPGTLMAGVASPGGMTERGLDHLNTVGLDDDVFEAMHQSLNIFRSLNSI